jgi:hypothetical protein
MQEIEFEVMENGLVAIPTYFVADDQDVRFLEARESDHPWDDDEAGCELQR